MLENYFIEILLYFIFAVGISAFINKILLRFSRSLGIRNKNDVVIRWSNESKPSLGGVSMFFTFLFAILAFAIYNNSAVVFDNVEFIGLLGASTLAFGIGVADDAYNTRPFLKLFGQILCGVILVITDTSVDFFHNSIADGILTVVWIVTIMNSLNMLDNMDGITATVSLFVLIACSLSLLILNDFNIDFWQIILITEIGALIGFLIFNVHPAKLFMGDTGSQFIGLFVGFFGIKALWNVPAVYQLPAWSGMVLALVAFSPAAADTLTVVINRIKKGRSPMIGGKDHTTHHLVYKGLTDFKVWLVFLLLSLLSVLVGVVLMVLLKNGIYLGTLIGIPFFLVLFLFLYRNTIKYSPPDSKGK
ncbi:MAG: MraY family glycosyltransferase [Brumimicrobium sp.]|nr:MraY family glycosyltransferase [Brumimicrobium sp.]